MMSLFPLLSIFRFSCTPHGPSAKFFVENGESEAVCKTCS